MLKSLVLVAVVVVLASACVAIQGPVEECQCPCSEGGTTAPDSPEP
jgi:hypothetical protein